MLTVQMQNQDPMNPMESADFAVQLATFSNVEQQVRTNDILTGLRGQIETMGMAQLSGWVGMEARAAVATEFRGEPLTLYPEPPTGAEQVSLVVRDSTGREVQRTDITGRSGELEWAGVTAGGAPLPEGIYSFEIESRVADQPLRSTPVEVFAEVSEARIVDGEVRLLLGGATEVASDEVSALRRPG